VVSFVVLEVSGGRAEGGDVQDCGADVQVSRHWGSDSVDYAVEDLGGHECAVEEERGGRG
jgi:hypothetical protein